MKHASNGWMGLVGVLVVVLALGAAVARASIVEVEGIITNPGVLGTGTANDGKYGLVSFWTVDSGDTLALANGETLGSSADVPQLQITGLLPGGMYGLNARLTYQQNRSIYYSYTSASDAVGASPLVIGAC